MKMRPMKKAPKKKTILAYAYWHENDGEEAGGYYVTVCWSKKLKYWMDGTVGYYTNQLIGWWPVPKRPKVRRPNGKKERLKA